MCSIGVALLIASCSSFTEAPTDSDTIDSGSADGSIVDGTPPDASDGAALPTVPSQCTVFSGPGVPADWMQITTNGGTIKFQQGAEPAAQAMVTGTQSATLSHRLTPGSDGTLDISVDLSVGNTTVAGVATELVRLTCGADFVISVDIGSTGMVEVQAQPSISNSSALGTPPQTRTPLRLAVMNGTMVTASLGDGATAPIQVTTSIDTVNECTLSIGAAATAGATTVSYFEACIE